LFFIFNYVISINAKIKDTATEKIKEVAIFSVNDAVLNSISLLNYDDLVVYEKDTTGQIALISINSTLSNKINRTVSDLSKNIIENELKDGVPIPVGIFTGIGFLSGKGKNVYLKVFNVQSVVCDFKSKFDDAGINQTLHSLYLDVEVQASLIYNGVDKVIRTNSEVLLAENLIVGKIPEFYLNSNKN
jgi:sporulation protein YunB